jgi:hypothetical protein
MKVAPDDSFTKHNFLSHIIMSIWILKVAGALTHESSWSSIFINEYNGTIANQLNAIDPGKWRKALPCAYIWLLRLLDIS